MIEQYISVGVLLTGYDFSEARGNRLQEVNSGIRNGELSITETRTVAIWCGLRRATESETTTKPFRFLPYAGGAINYCEAQGVDVISAYFSGCIMASYKRDGVLRVCHVSTGGPDDCKDAWATIQAEAGVTEVKGFKPSDHAPAARILGLITSTGDCYAIGCNPESGGLRVTSIVKVP